MRLTRREFRDKADEALERVPRKFLRLLHNVRIEALDAPGPEAGKWSGSATLLGLYSGLNRAEMLSPFSGTYEPARIFLYQRNIEDRAQTPEELDRLVYDTLRHELAHHFGFTDEDLKKKWPEGA